MNEKEVDLFDLLAALRAGGRLILVGTVVICALAAVLSLLLPDEYEAQIQLLPPKEQKQGFGFADLLSALPIPSLRLGEKGTPADIFVAILKSPTLRRRLVEDFDLLRIYETDSPTDAIETLQQNTTIGKSEEGTIMIAVMDRDPRRAAAMANRYTALLDSTNISLTRTAAAERLAFIKTLKAAEEEKLQAAMQNLQEFQAAHNAISIEDQARAVIKAAAEMQMSAMELEIARQALLAAGTSPSHPEVQKRADEKLLRQQALVFLRDGDSDSLGVVKTRLGGALQLDENLFLPLRKIPQVAQDYARIEKNVLVESALIKMLLEQEAEALIESSNATSTVQVLDAAMVPEKKARPRRLLIVFITGVLSLFASSFYVLGAAYVRAIRGRWQAEYGS